MMVTCLTIHVVKCSTSTLLYNGKTFVKKTAENVEWQQGKGGSWLSDCSIRVYQSFATTCHKLNVEILL